MVILFDGVCNLCNGLVKFIIKRDKKKRFRFAALQSGYAKYIEKNYGLNLADLNTVILIKYGKVYTKSSAVLHIARELGFPYSLSICFFIIPPFIRNYFYSFVAKNRYRWFGTQSHCMVPSQELNERFITQDFMGDL